MLCCTQTGYAANRSDVGNFATLPHCQVGSCVKENHMLPKLQSITRQKLLVSEWYVSNEIEIFRYTLCMSWWAVHEVYVEVLEHANQHLSTMDVMTVFRFIVSRQSYDLVLWFKGLRADVADTDETFSNIYNSWSHNADLPHDARCSESPTTAIEAWYAV